MIGVRRSSMNARSLSSQLRLSGLSSISYSLHRLSDFFVDDVRKVSCGGPWLLKTCCKYVIRTVRNCLILKYGSNLQDLLLVASNLVVNSFHILHWVQLDVRDDQPAMCLVALNGFGYMDRFYEILVLCIVDLHQKL